jgi:hypothetical protein
MRPFCPHVCSMFARAHGPSNPGLVKNGPSDAPDAAPGSLDQWSRPHTQTEGAPGVPIPMRSHSVQPAGKRHSHSGYVTGAGARARRLPAKDARDGDARPGSGADCRRTLEALICWALVRTRPRGDASGLRGDGSGVPDIGVPGKLGRGRPQPGRMPRAGGVCRRRVRSCPHGGCVGADVATERKVPLSTR